jgi:hypothetical protein
VSLKIGGAEIGGRELSRILARGFGPPRRWIRSLLDQTLKYFPKSRDSGELYYARMVRCHRRAGLVHFHFSFFFLLNLSSLTFASIYLSLFSGRTVMGINDTIAIRTEKSSNTNGVASTLDFTVKAGLAQMLKGGVITDVANAKQVSLPFSLACDLASF